MEEVCIVGAGVSGLISAKFCLEHNLIPFIVEKTDSIGGIWKGAEGEIGTWNSLTANTSKVFSRISDHPWPKTAKEFPTRAEMLEYYTSFANKHQLFQYIHFRTSVSELSKNGENYSVTLTSENSSVIQTFKYVILATGYFSKLIDNIPGRERFKGVVLHSAYYRDPSIFEGKKVVVVGNAFSACDIASEACVNSESVTQIYKKSMFFLKRKAMGLPFECFLYNILSRFKCESFITTKESNEASMRKIERLCGNPGDYLEDLRITDSDLRNNFQRLSIHLDEYLNCLKNAKIKCVSGAAQELSENGLVLSDGREIPADVIILGTGYYCNYDYLSQELQHLLNYDPKNKNVALTLFRTTIHPALPRLAFTGSFNGPFPGKYEIQALLAVKWIAGQLSISDEELWEGVRMEERLRDELPDNVYVYNIGSAVNEFLRILGIQIDYEFLDSLGYRNGPFCTVFLFKDKPGHEELIREFVKEYKETYPHFDFNQIIS